MQQPNLQQPILIILHQEHSTPGRLGNALGQLGYRLDVRRPRFGEKLPPTMAEHDANFAGSLPPGTALPAACDWPSSVETGQLS